MQSTRELESREDVDPRGTSHNGGVIGFSDINSGLVGSKPLAARQPVHHLLIRW